MIYHRLWLGSVSNYRIINIFIFKDLVFTHVHEFILYFFILQVWQGLLKFSQNYLNLDLQITLFFKNKHFELCCLVMYRVRNIVNTRKNDVICHSVRRSRVLTSMHSYVGLTIQIWWRGFHYLIIFSNKGFHQIPIFHW